MPEPHFPVKCAKKRPGKVLNRSVKIAAVLCWCYAAPLAYEAIHPALAEARLDKEHLVRHLLGVVLFAVFGWALLRGYRWAWYVVVTFTSALGLLGVVLVLTLVHQSNPERHAMMGQIERALRVGSGAGYPLLVFSVAVLAGIVLSLLRKDARDAFFLPPRQ